ncbi:MAG: copper homeostasis protein CutC [Solobacterium sp.]|nr:copper homeostasis protein CutC [Solobacterium sp.]
MFSENLIEICAGSAEDVMTACRFPIDRIELNSALELGGLTPSLSVLRFAKEHASIPIMCMIRPRAAGFIYSETEFEIMRSDAKLMLENGADGIVFGFLNPDHTVDEERTAALANLAHSYGRQAVFHRAFDQTADPFSAAEALIRCGIDRVLTSGQKDTAPEGASLIAELIQRYEPSLSILPGAGINADTILDVKQKTGARQFHMTAKSLRNDSGTYPAVDARNIQAVMNVLRTCTSASGQPVLTREDAEMLEQEHYEQSLAD